MTVPNQTDSTYCHECGADNFLWLTDNVLWNLTLGDDRWHDPGGSLCPNCFLTIATQKHEIGMWRIIPGLGHLMSPVDFMESETRPGPIPMSE